MLANRITAPWSGTSFLFLGRHLIKYAFDSMQESHLISADLNPWYSSLTKGLFTLLLAILSVK